LKTRLEEEKEEKEEEKGENEEEEKEKKEEKEEKEERDEKEEKEMMKERLYSQIRLFFFTTDENNIETTIGREN
jgi:hypothetical protein